jgi:hypothetical protein
MRNNIIKVAALVAMAVIISASNADAGDRKGIDKDLIMKNFEYSLTWNEYPGIVESTLYNVVVYKSLYPDLDYTQLSAMLKDVAKESKNPTIGYKAQLAYMYLNYSSTIEVAPGNVSPNYLFKEISEKLEQRFLASQTVH